MPFGDSFSSFSMETAEAVSRSWLAQPLSPLRASLSAGSIGGGGGHSTLWDPDVVAAPAQGVRIDVGQYL